MRRRLYRFDFASSGRKKIKYVRLRPEYTSSFKNGGKRALFFCNGTKYFVSNLILRQVKILKNCKQMSHQHTRVQNLQYSTTLIVLALLPLCFVIGLSNSRHSLDQNLNRLRLSHWRFRALEANFLGEALALRCSIKMRPFIRFPTNNALCRSPKLNCTCSSKD